MKIEKGMKPIVKNAQIKSVFSDKRGDIFDLVEEKMGHVGMVTFTKGAVRGNHYHKRSVQYSYVIDGELDLITSDIKGKNKKKFLLKKGTLTRIPPKVVHTYIAKSKACILDMTTLNRKDNGYEKDTVKVAG